MVILVPTVNVSGAASLAPTATVTSNVITDFNSLISNVDANATVVDYEALAERLMFQLEKSWEKMERAFEANLETPEAARAEYRLGVEALNETRELISSGEYQAAAQLARGALNHFGNAYRIFREHVQATEGPEETDEPSFNETERGLKVAIERGYTYLGRLNATVVSLEGDTASTLARDGMRGQLSADLLDYLRVNSDNILARLIPQLGHRWVGFFPGLVAVGLAAVAIAAVYRVQAKPSHSEPFLRIARNLCLSCAACVAVCEPQSLLLRGLELTFGALTCTGCSECLRICPTAALLPTAGRFYKEKP